MKLGKKGYGYDVQYLLDVFRQVLDQDERMNVAIIGVGNLGSALLKYNFQNFKNRTKAIKSKLSTTKTYNDIACNYLKNISLNLSHNISLQK